MGELSQIPFLRDTVHVTLQVMAMKHWDRPGYQVPKEGKWWIYENHVLIRGHGSYCKMVEVEHETSEWLRQVFAVAWCTYTICWFFGPGRRNGSETFLPKSVKSEASCSIISLHVQVRSFFQTSSLFPGTNYSNRTNRHQAKSGVSFLEVLCPQLPLLPQSSTHMISGTDMTISKSNQPFAYTHWQNISQLKLRGLWSFGGPSFLSQQPHRTEKWISMIRGCRNDVLQIR